MISIIVAASTNNVIGQSNDLPWYLPADLKNFARITTGHTVVMGRKTFESIVNKLGKPLPNRQNIVITRQENYQVPAGVMVVNSIEEAIKKAENNQEIFIIGGAQIYNLAFPVVDRIYMTRIHTNIEGDAYFPEFNENEWELISEKFNQREGKNSYDYSFLIYERRK